MPNPAQLFVPPNAHILQLASLSDRPAIQVNVDETRQQTIIRLRSMLDDAQAENQQLRDLCRRALGVLSEPPGTSPTREHAVVRDLQSVCDRSLTL